MTIDIASPGVNAAALKAALFASLNPVPSTYANRDLSAVEGALAIFTDSIYLQPSMKVSGGGSNRVEARFNGTDWIITAGVLNNLELPSRRVLGYGPDVNYYVRTPPVTVTIPVASPALVNWTAHGLVAGDAVIFATPRDRGVCTITIASPAVVTFNAHGYENGDPVLLSTTGALPTGLSEGGYGGGTTYYVVNKATNTFELEASVGGGSINTSGTQSGTHRVMRNSTMPSNITAGLIYYVLAAGLTANAFQIAATAGGTAINVTVAAVGKVRASTGNDNNTGLGNDKARAWLTYDKVRHFINSEIDGTEVSPVIHFAEGLYLKRLVPALDDSSLHVRMGAIPSYVYFWGDQTADFNSNVVIQAATPVALQHHTQLFCEYLTLINTDAFGACILVDNWSFLELYKCEYYTAGAFSRIIGAGAASDVRNYGPSLIARSSSFYCFMQAYDATTVYWGHGGAGYTTYVEGNPAVTYWIDFSLTAHGRFRTPFEGAATGGRFNVTELAQVKTDSALLTYFPGSTAGVVSKEGVYFANQVINQVTSQLVVAFASLPASAPEGTEAIITDSNTAVWGATIAGGGANRVLAHFNGTNWTVKAI